MTDMHDVIPRKTLLAITVLGSALFIAGSFILDATNASEAVALLTLIGIFGLCAVLIVRAHPESKRHSR